MKPLAEYPTPLTDHAGYRVFEVCADLERKLATARDAIQTIGAMLRSKSDDDDACALSEIEDVTDEALAATAPTL